MSNLEARETVSFILRDRRKSALLPMGSIIKTKETP